MSGLLGVGRQGDLTMRIFISYRREDCEREAAAIYYGIRVHRPDAEVFFDVDSIAPGIDFLTEIEREVARADVALVLIGDSWLTNKGDGDSPRIADPNDYVNREVRLALERGIAVIPVLLEGAKMPRPDELPENIAALARRNAIEVSQGSLTRDIGILASQIEAALPATGAELEVAGAASEEAPAAAGHDPRTDLPELAERIRAEARRWPGSKSK